MLLLLLLPRHRVDEGPLAIIEPQQASDGLLSLELVLQHSRSAAHDLYPVCQPLAAQVVQGCSRVTCHSMGDLAVLLDSPRWGERKTVTALTVSTVSPQELPQAALHKPTVQVAKARQLCVWVTVPGTTLKTYTDDADLAVYQTQFFRERGDLNPRPLTPCSQAPRPAVSGALPQEP